MYHIPDALGLNLGPERVYPKSLFVVFLSFYRYIPVQYLQLLYSCLLAHRIRFNVHCFPTIHPLQIITNSVTKYAIDRYKRNRTIASYRVCKGRKKDF